MGRSWTQEDHQAWTFEFFCRARELTTVPRRRLKFKPQLPALSDEKKYVAATLGMHYDVRAAANKKVYCFYLQPLCAAETNREMEQKSAEICSTFFYSSVFTTVVKSKVTSHELNHLKQAFELFDPGFEP